jgi:hypothetical protein
MSAGPELGACDERRIRIFASHEYWYLYARVQSEFGSLSQTKIVIAMRPVSTAERLEGLCPASLAGDNDAGWLTAFNKAPHAWKLRWLRGPVRVCSLVHTVGTFV